jgi:hypothetical protein
MGYMKKPINALCKQGFVPGQWGWKSKWLIITMQSPLILNFTKISLMVYDIIMEVHSWSHVKQPLIWINMAENQ